VEIDIHLLRSELFSYCGLVWDLRQVPTHLLHSQESQEELAANRALSYPIVVAAATLAGRLFICGAFFHYMIRVSSAKLPRTKKKEPANCHTPITAAVALLLLPIALPAQQEDFSKVE